MYLNMLQIRSLSCFFGFCVVFIYSLRHAAGHQLEPARLVAMARACVAVRRLRKG